MYLGYLLEPIVQIWQIILFSKNLANFPFFSQNPLYVSKSHFLRSKNTKTIPKNKK